MIELTPVMPWTPAMPWVSWRPPVYYNVDTGRVRNCCRCDWPYGLPPFLSCFEGTTEKDKKERHCCYGISLIILTLGILTLVLYFLGILNLFGSSPKKSVVVPVCTFGGGMSMRLAYQPSSNSLQDLTGLGCTVDMETTQIVSSGIDSLIGPYWTGYTQRGFNLVNCSAYTWTQWMQLQNAVILSNRVMTIYSQDNPASGPFPLTAFLQGCGLAVLGSHTYAIPQNTWVHVGIVYDDTTRTNTWYINGNQVFTWAAYTDPPPNPYLAGVMTLNLYPLQDPSMQILFGETHLWCDALSPSEIQQDAAIVTPTFPPLAVAYPTDSSVQAQGPLPTVQYQGNTDTNDLSAFFCVFPTVERDQAIPNSLPNTYTVFYIDQVSGSDSALGLGTGASAWKTPQNTAMFGNIAYDYSITSINTAFQNGLSIPAQETQSGISLEFTNYPQVVSGAGILPNGLQCNLWYFDNANTGFVTTALEGGGSTDGTSSLWLKMLSVTGKVLIPPNGGYAQIGTIQTSLTAVGDGSSYVYKFGSTTNTLQTTLQYGVTYYVTAVWSCTFSYLELYVNGELVESQVGDLQTCPQIGPAYLDPFINTDGIDITFTGYLGGMSMHFIALPTTTVQALYNVMSSSQSPCALAEICLGVMMCQNDRYFGVAQGMQFVQSKALCPLYLDSYDCGRGTDTPLISGAVILPQTSLIGWNEIQYTNPITGLTSNLLMYDLTELYRLTGTSFLPSNPLQPFGRYPPSNIPIASTEYAPSNALPGYMPIVMNDLYLTPRGPNVDDPRYPFGHRFSHSLHPLSYLSQGNWQDNSSPNPTFYPPAYYVANSHLQPTPGSWCHLTWDEMCNKSNSCYFALNISALNEAQTWSLAWTYDNGYPSGNPTFSNVGSGLIDCENWMNTEISNGSPTAPNLTWTDPSLGLFGLWPSHVNQPGYIIPQCEPACFQFIEYWDQIYPPTPNTPPPPLTPNPHAWAEGGWQSLNSYYFQGDQFTSVYFDGPGEAYYNQTSGHVLLFPWNDAHRQALLTTSELAPNPTIVLQNPALTANWARLMDRNTVFGVTVGYGGYTSLTTKAGAIVQNIAISHFNGWGLVINTEQPSTTTNVSMSYNLNHILLRVNTGHSFVVDSTLVNTTRPWYGLDMDDDGIGVFCITGTFATCNIIDTDIITTVGSSSANLFRGVRIVDNAGQAAITGNNNMWVEHTLFNITQQFTGDSGNLYNDPTPTTFLWNTFDNTAQSQSMNLNLQSAFTFGSIKAGFARAGGYWIGQSLVWHGNQFLNLVFDAVGLTGGPTIMSYNVDSFAQITSNLFTGGSFIFTIPGFGQTYPTTRQGAMGRPWGFNNCYAIYDDVLYNPITMMYDYPLFGPGFQGADDNSLWRWGPNVSSWVQGYQICYGQLDFSGNPDASTIGPNDLAYSDYAGILVPSQTTKSIAGAVADWELTQENDNPLPQFGMSTCQNLRDTVKQQLYNEGQLHYWSTQSALRAIIHSQQPFYVETPSTPLLEASEWEEPMSRYNPSGDTLWPAEEIYTPCSDITSCNPYLITKLSSVSATSEWVDSQGSATLAFEGFNGIGDYGDMNPRYVGNSWDVDRGLVIDTCFAQGLYYSLNASRVYTQFTITFWWMLPTFSSNYIIALNRDTPTFLRLGGDVNNNPGGTIYADTQGSSGTIGGATPHIQNANSGCCPFNDLPITTGGTCPYDRSLMDQWIHFSMAVSVDYQYTELYMNGESVFDCVDFGGLGDAIQPVWGGPTPMAFLQRWSGKVADFRVYAGKLSDSTVQSIYSSSASTYVGPTTFDVFGNNQLIQVGYSTELDTFVFAPSVTDYTVSFLGMFNNSFLVPDPLQQISTPVIDRQAQFSFPTPAGLTTWTITIQAMFTNTPNFSPLFFIPYPTSQYPGTAQLMIVITGPTEICLYQGVTQVLSIPQYNQQSCITGTSFPLNVWATWGFTFNSNTGDAALYYNGALVGSFTGASLQSYLTTQRALEFQIPTFYWLYTQSRTSTLNIGYINTISIYSILLYS